MSIDNLQRMFERADNIDMCEGSHAYNSYNALLRRIAAHYDHDFNRVVACFVSLSPNSDYFGNLRSLVSCLEGINCRDDQIVVSTYGHCKVRALRYLRGEANFLDEAKGLKIRAFYHNIIDPSDIYHVTVDGHICATWRGDDNGTMKSSALNRSEYFAIQDAIKRIAFMNFLIPSQVQAIIWFVRKRVLRIVYDDQIDLLSGAWRVMRDINEITPYRRRT